MYLNFIKKRAPKHLSVKKLGRLIIMPIVTVFLFAACSSPNNSGGPRTMPTPNDTVKQPITPGATITPEPKSAADDTDSLGSDVSSLSSDNDAGASDSNTASASGDSTVNSDETDADQPKTKSGYVVVLDPGHGGKYTGAIYYNTMEKDLTLQMANYVKEYLLDNYEGIEVYFTRDSDIELDSDLKIELENRAQVAKEHNADFFVSLHFNASEAHTLNGATVYASFREHVAEKSQGIALSILQELVGLGLKNNNVKTRKSADYKADDGSALDYYAVIRHSAARDIPGVIVEHCFMDSEIDHAFMDTDDKLRELAKADAVGIANYLKLKTKSSE